MFLLSRLVSALSQLLSVGAKLSLRDAVLLMQCFQMCPQHFLYLENNTADI
jgi:hypothetical protein